MKNKQIEAVGEQPQGLGEGLKVMEASKKARGLGLLMLCGVSLGCPAQGEDVLPPVDQLTFPTDLVFDQNRETLFAVNSNANRLFSSGSIQAFDYPSIVSAAKAWRDSSSMPTGSECETDVDFPGLLVCDESSFVLSETTTRLGNFASTIVSQQLDDGRTRLFTTVRGDPSLTWIDWNPTTARLECSEDEDGCAPEHRLSSIRNDADLGLLPPEPFGLYVDEENETVAVTDLALGTLTLADAPKNGETPLLTDSLGGFFSLGTRSAVGAFGVAGQFRGNPDNKLYVTSINENRLQTFTVTRHGGRPILLPSEFFFLGGQLDFTETRGLAFNESGSKLAVINRSPPLVHVIDTSFNEQRTTRNETLGQIEICDDSSEILVREADGRTLAFVNCFVLGQIWALDLDRFEVISLIDVGLGPYAMDIDEEEGLLVVGNYLENSLSFIDIDPGQITTNRPLLKIGFSNDGEEQ